MWSMWARQVLSTCGKKCNSLSDQKQTSATGILHPEIAQKASLQRGRALAGGAFEGF